MQVAGVEVMLEAKCEERTLFPSCSRGHMQVAGPEAAPPCLQH